jgi:hypothetical protein
VIGQPVSPEQTQTIVIRSLIDDIERFKVREKTQFRCGDLPIVRVARLSIKCQAV